VPTGMFASLRVNDMALWICRAAFSGGKQDQKTVIEALDTERQPLAA
jgi:hypothetical protein